MSDNFTLTINGKSISGWTEYGQDSNENDYWILSGDICTVVIARLDVKPDIKFFKTA